MSFKKYKYLSKIPSHKRDLFKLYDWIRFTDEVLKEKDWQNYTCFTNWVKLELNAHGMNVGFIPKVVTKNNYVNKFGDLGRMIDLDSFKLGAVIADETIKIRRGKYCIPKNWYDFEKIGNEND